MLEVLSCPEKHDTLWVFETVALLGDNFILKRLDAALDINRSGGAHGEERLGNLQVEGIVCSKSLKEA